MVATESDEMARAAWSVDGEVEAFEIGMMQNFRRQEMTWCALKTDAGNIRKRLRKALRRSSTFSVVPLAEDTSFVRQYEWRVRNAGDLETRAHDSAIYSPKFNILGIPDFQLELFPTGRTGCPPGFCSVFLWSSAGVSIKYRLGMGMHYSAVNDEEFDIRKASGCTNFCDFDGQIDEGTDTVTLRLEVLDLTWRDVERRGLRLIKESPEALVRRKMEHVILFDIDTVEWSISDGKERGKEMPSGVAFASKCFGVARMPDVTLQIYPCGIRPLSEAELAAAAAAEEAEAAAKAKAKSKGKAKAKPAAAAPAGPMGQCSLYVWAADVRDEVLASLGVGPIKPEPLAQALGGKKPKGHDKLGMSAKVLSAGPEAGLLVTMLLENKTEPRTEIELHQDLIV